MAAADPDWGDVPTDAPEFDFAAAANTAGIEAEKQQFKAESGADKGATYNKNNFFDNLKQTTLGEEGDEKVEDWEGGAEKP